MAGDNITRTYCEGYRGWHISFVTDGGYVIHDRKDHAHISEGYCETREEARKEIDWHIANPEPVEVEHEDTPSLDPPWWHYR